MKTKILVILGIIILLIILSVIAIIAYFLIVDIQSKKPAEEIKECKIESKNFIGRKIYIITPVEKIDKYIIYFHGGSYVGEMSEDHWNFVQNLSKDTGCTVVVPDYPLAPKYTYEDVFNMAIPLYKEVIDRTNSDKVILMGDSAGGGIALALEEKLGEDNVDLPSKLILISPWLDTTMSNPEIDKVQKLDKDLNKEALKIAGIAYAGKNGGDSYLVNPINGPLNKLKNVTIYTGTYDILNPDVHILIEKAKEQNVSIELKEYEGEGHIWIVRDIKTEAYKQLVNRNLWRILKILYGEYLIKFDI